MPEPVLEIYRQLIELDYTPILLAMVLGGVIGLERELHGRPAGMRTHMLVCVSATILVLASKAVPELGDQQSTIVFDPQRLAAGIVTGIGFLGAAAVIRSGDIVRGLTTGACIWCVAGLGVVIGQGAYALAIATATAYMFVLVVLDWLPQGLGRVVYRRLRVRGNSKDVQAVADRVRSILRRHKVRVQELTGKVGVNEEAGDFEVVLHVRCRSTMQAPTILTEVNAVSGVRSVDWMTPR